MINEARTDFPRVDAKYPFDDESGVYLNTKGQWSESPYLGATRNKNGKYVAQIHIPNYVWENLIRDNHKWFDILPDSFFAENPNNRSTIRVGVNDPRQAAWIMQSVLYGPYNTEELINDYLIQKYVRDGKGIDAWQEIFADMPKFYGSPIQIQDHDEWFNRNQEHEKKNKLATNIEKFKHEAPAKIKKGLEAFLSKQSNRKKMFGRSDISLNGALQLVDKAINEFGVDSFLNGIKLKDPSTLTFHQIAEGFVE